MKYRGEYIGQLDTNGTRLYRWGGTILTLLPAIRAIIDYHLDSHNTSSQSDDGGLYSLHPAIPVRDKRSQP